MGLKLQYQYIIGQVSKLSIEGQNYKYIDNSNNIKTLPLELNGSKFTFHLYHKLKLKYSRSKNSFGLNFGLAIPTGDMSNTNNMGIDFSAAIKIVTSNPSVGATLGASYISLSGKTKTGIIYNSKNLISIFAGPQIGKEKGPYFLPAITANFSEGDSRIGLDIGGGYLVPLKVGNTKLNVGAKYSIVNLIKEDEGEDLFNVIRILAGINF